MATRSKAHTNGDREVSEIVNDRLLGKIKVLKEAAPSEEFATINDLLEPGDEEDPFEIVELKSGKKVALRGVTRAEMHMFRNKQMDPAIFEQKLLSICMVEPSITPKQVAAWQRRDKVDGDIKKLTDVAMALSGMNAEVTSKSNSEMDDQ